jgi:hypothetical protein
MPFYTIQCPEENIDRAAILSREKNMRESEAILTVAKEEEEEGRSRDRPLVICN